MNRQSGNDRSNRSHGGRGGRGDRSGGGGAGDRLIALADQIVGRFYHGADGAFGVGRSRLRHGISGSGSGYRRGRSHRRRLGGEFLLHLLLVDLAQSARDRLGIRRNIAALLEQGEHVLALHVMTFCKFVDTDTHSISGRVALVKKQKT